MRHGSESYLQRTDWIEQQRLRLSLAAAIDYADQLERPHTRRELEALLAWLYGLYDEAMKDGIAYPAVPGM